MPNTLKPIARIFKKYSNYPLLIGLSHLSEYDSEGEKCSDPNFPFCLTLKPTVGEKKRCSTSHGESSFVDDMKALPIGTILYDVFASPDPLSVMDPRKLQRIGRLVSTSEMMPSPSNDGLIFRHQVKDEDFILRPSWEHQILESNIKLEDGSVGSAAAVAGCKYFENQIQQNVFTDFQN